MAQVDFQERQLTLKLVYYGPALSGKTTNLKWLHSQVEQAARGRLMTLNTRDDRTLFFDLLPIFFRTSNLSFRVKVYTVPGQPLHEATRRVVLRGADGVAFIADSRRDASADNNQSYGEMLKNFDAVGLDRARLPVVIQYNKQDLPDALGGDELASLAAGSDEPLIPACALDGRGVFETLLQLLHDTWCALDADVGLASGFGLEKGDFMRAVRQHLGAVGS